MPRAESQNSNNESVSRRRNRKLDRTPRRGSDSNSGGDFDSAVQGVESLVGNDLSLETFEHHASLLGDPRMSHPSNTAQRTTLMQKLQRDYGNPYVQRLVDHIHRKREQTIQTKLSVGAAGDKYEQEADRVAKQVVSRLNSSSDSESKEQKDEKLIGEVYQQAVNRITRYIAGNESHLGRKPVRRADEEDENEEELNPRAMVLRKPEEGQIGLEGGDVSPDVEGSINSARGGGKPLPDNVRGSMEGAFGANFGDVRVHTGSEADSLNKSMSARAFTTGNDIFFAKGEYNPGSKGGQETLAHELTHVVQQTDGTLERKEEAIQTTSAIDAAVQRAFGFEVEVPLFLSYTPPGTDEPAPRDDAMTGSGGNAIFQPTDNFEIKVDHNLELDSLAEYENQLNGGDFPSHASIIELVTKPWDEQTLTSKDVKKRTKEMVNWVNEAKKRADKGQSHLGNGYYLGSNSPDAKAFQSTDGYIQATYGVKLSSVPELIEKTTKVNPDVDDHDTIKQASAIGRKVMTEISLIDNGWDDNVEASDSKSLEGYVILLANYLLAGAGGGSKVGLGKNAIGQYFYKTDMGKLANTLPQTVLDRLSDQTNGSIDTLYDELLDQTGRTAGEEIIKDIGIQCGQWLWDVLWGYKDTLLPRLKNEYSVELGPDMLGPEDEDQESGVVMENREVQYLDPNYKKKKKAQQKELEKYYKKVNKDSKKGIAQTQQGLAKALAQMTDPKKFPTKKWEDMFMRVYTMIRELNS